MTTQDAAQTVEEVVREQLAKALGGRRGMAEAAIPTIAFTVVFLIGHDLRRAVFIALGCAALLLVGRILHRSTPQFVLNSLFGVGIGALFAWRAAQSGADAGDQALAYFLPGIIYNAGYAVVMATTVLIRWPLVGFMVGSVTGDPVAWHGDRGIVRLCGRLTWLLALPCVIRVVAQTPVYLAGRNGWWDESSAIATLAVLKLAMGWPLQIAALTGMVWLLSRNKTPMAGPAR